MTPSTGSGRPSAVTTLTARCPDDIIAAACVVLGFIPTESVVMLTFDAAHRFHARLDLPRSADELAEVADTLLEPAVRHRAARVVLLFFTDDRRLGDATWRRLRDAARDRGIDVAEALRVGASRWYPYRAGDPRLREVGVPYDVGAHPFLVRAVVDGRVTHRSREQLAATLDPVSEQVAAVVALLDRWPPWPPDEQLEVSVLRREGAWVQHLVSEHVQRGTDPSDVEVVRLLRAVQLVRLRDAAWALVDRPGAAQHLAFWTRVIRRCPRALLPPVAAMVAWAAWQSGDGALAWCGIDRCTAVDPDYSLAHLLAHALAAALPPSSWEGGFDWAEGLTG